MHRQNILSAASQKMPLFSFLLDRLTCAVELAQRGLFPLYFFLLCKDPNGSFITCVASLPSGVPPSAISLLTILLSACTILLWAFPPPLMCSILGVAAPHAAASRSARNVPPTSFERAILRRRSMQRFEGWDAVDEGAVL